MSPPLAIVMLEQNESKQKDEFEVENYKKFNQKLRRKEKIKKNTSKECVKNE